MLCGIYLVICATPYAAAFSNLEQLPIDPWKDLEDMQNRPEILPEVPDPKDEVESVPELKEELPPLKGGASTLSLNDDNMTRYIRVKGAVWYGEIEREYYAVPAGTLIHTYEGAASYLLASTYIADPSWSLFNTIGYTTKVDWVAPLQIGALAGGKLNVSGQVFVAFRTLVTNESVVTGNPSIKAETTPDYAQLLVNGEPYGDIFNVVNGGFSIPQGVYIPLDSGISEIGFRFTAEAKKTDDTTTNFADYNYRSAYFYIDDESVFSVFEEPGEPEYNGILGSIIGWLENVYNAIANLSINITDGLLEGISGLFVPDEEEMAELQERYSELLAERLGFIYQTYDWTHDTVTGIVETMKTQDEYSFVFPGISFPYNGEIIVLVEEQEVSLDNALMDVLRPVLGTVVSLIAVAAWAEMAFDMFIAVVSGISYFTFLSRRREEE